ncbi:MAG: tRNA pseudouridine(13) synthase TruD [Methanobacteriaceae archaeon]|nr:tRNA pseudouridine(13) synthase TruD [Methanobacteriaceae archaeon]
MLNAKTYITDNEGIGGRIRAKYEDFYVEELPETLPSGKGPNTWLFIEKVGRNTLDVVLDIARILHISRKRMGFAGMKDKKALTRQWLCVSNIKPEELLNLENQLHNVKILSIMPNEKKLRIGQLLGNKFRILIREVDDIQRATKTANKVLSKLLETGVPNYYGWQRFGYPRTNTHRVGRALIDNDLKKTVDSYIGNPYDNEPDYIKNARRLYDQGNIQGSYNEMPSKMRYERMMLRVILKEQKKKNKLDDISYKKAIESLPKPLKRMFVHAYQSYLFNQAVSERAKYGINKYVEGDILIDNDEHLVHEFKEEEADLMIKNFKIHPTAPLFGSKVPLAGGSIGEMEENILKSENISKNDFEVPKMPKLGSHGLRRSIRFKIWDTSAIATNDGVLIQFSIPKGCYATAVLREIMKNEVV